MTTTLADAVAAANLDATTTRRILGALTPEDVTVTVTVHHSGWVPNAYRYAANGYCTTTTITTTGVTETSGRYNMKRSGGKGADVAVLIAKPNQRRGRYV
jgi:hypothetical protein